LAATRQTACGVALHTGITRKSKDGRHVFNGEVTALPAGHDSWTWPLTWPGAEHPLLGAGKPSLIFAAGLSDLFFEGHPKAVVDRILATLAMSDHIGLILTRRVERMRDYFLRRSWSAPRLRRWKQHLWLGFSAERQKEFNERWPHVRALAADGWTTFVSIAPMIGPVTLPDDFLAHGNRIWVIVSGEQGKHSLCRDMDPRWACAVRDQCRAAGVPLFVKQMSKKAPIHPDLQIREFPKVAT
jgi:protein gp37